MTPDNLSRVLQSQNYFHYDSKIPFAFFSMLTDGAKVMVCKTANTLAKTSHWCRIALAVIILLYY